MSSVKIPKFENDVIDLLLCSVAQDSFRTRELQSQLEDVFDKITIDQLQDTIQILLKCHNALESVKMKKMLQSMS